jgi:2-C-methyl-D-erythritol 4-phosphate cytidylyltransferase
MPIKNTSPFDSLIVVVPAAGVGKRMAANCPKQYLTLKGKTILEHTVNRLLAHPAITKVILSLGEHDEYFLTTPLVHHPDVIRVTGGKERVDSVLNGLKAVDQHTYPWVMVHDAARPCVRHEDIDALVNFCKEQSDHKAVGGLLAAPASDTMKLTDNELSDEVKSTFDRSLLWHAFTPQMYPTTQLILAIEQAQKSNFIITDESSAMEFAGYASKLISSSSDNIKITRPDDLALAEFILMKQAANQLKTSNKQ